MSAPARLAIDLLKHTARRLPGKVAIRDGSEAITFRELWDGAVRFAGWLRDGHGGALPPVVVAVPKSIGAFVAIAGAQLAGAVYVPFDPDTPAERRARMLERLGPHLHVEGDRARLRVGERTFSLAPAPADEALERGLLAGLERRGEHEPLYVTFTSGTTGVPKGAAVSNASTLDYARWLVQEHAVTEADVIGNQSPLFFDSIVLDLYVTLASGATLLLIPREHFRLPGDLVSFLAEERISLIYFVPSTFASLAAMGALDEVDLPHLRRVIFSGEAMPLGVLHYLRSRLPRATLCNHYGPTECTDTATAWTAGPDLDGLADTPIGRPRPNVRILIVDDEDRPIPEPGAVGEVLIGGSCVGLGYWNDPETTAAKFVQNPEHARYRDLYYRTGDLGYRAADGLIYYVGRKDHQFKYLGNRIEAGEIETAILRLGPIGQCCVHYDAERTEIVAFVKGPLEAAEIRERLRTALPTYMIPRRVVALESFPLTPNGKIDRKAVWREHCERRG